MDKCETETVQMVVRGGYHIWWCKTHNRPLPWCDKERAVEQALAQQLKEIKRAATPYCCHTSGMHDPTHFENNPDELCSIQKSEAYDRLLEHLDWKPRVMTKPTGCYWCMSSIERKRQDKRN